MPRSVPIARAFWRRSIGRWRSKSKDRPQSIALWRGELLAPEPPRQGWLSKALDQKREDEEALKRAHDDKAVARSPHPTTPPPPDVPGPQGGLLDFLEQMKSPKQAAREAAGKAAKKAPGGKAAQAKAAKPAGAGKSATPQGADADGTPAGCAGVEAAGAVKQPAQPKNEQPAQAGKAAKHLAQRPRTWPRRWHSTPMSSPGFEVQKARRTEG